MRQSQSLAMPSSLSLSAVFTQLSLFHAMTKPSINSEVSEAETEALHRPDMQQLQRRLLIYCQCSFQPHGNKLTRNSYYSSLRDQTRQSAPALPCS